MSTEDPQLNYERAIAVLDQLREQGPIKAYNDIRAEVASRWPKSPAGLDATAWLKSTDAAIKERALRAAIAREVEYRAQIAQGRRQLEQSLAAEIEDAKGRAAAIVDTATARQEARQARRNGLHPVALIYAKRAFELRADKYSSLFVASSKRYAGLLDEALEHYRVLLLEHPHWEHVITGLAAVLADLGRITQAWDLLEPQPEDKHNRALKGRLRRLLGDLAGAERYLRRAMATVGDASHNADLEREVRELGRQANDAGDRAVAAAAQTLRVR
jgi:hypothetical protein